MSYGCVLTNSIYCLECSVDLWPSEWPFVIQSKIWIDTDCASEPAIVTYLYWHVCWFGAAPQNDARFKSGQN